MGCRAALQSAAVPAGAVGWVSVHGTGTALGDPLEVGALGSGLADPSRSNDIATGTVRVLSSKSCYGHTEGTAGITGTLPILSPCCALFETVKDPNPIYLLLRLARSDMMYGVCAKNGAETCRTAGGNHGVEANGDSSGHAPAHHEPLRCHRL